MEKTKESESNLFCHCFWNAPWHYYHLRVRVDSPNDRLALEITGRSIKIIFQLGGITNFSSTYFRVIKPPPTHCRGWWYLNNGEMVWKIQYEIRWPRVVKGMAGNCNWSPVSWQNYYYLNDFLSRFYNYYFFHGNDTFIVVAIGFCLIIVNVLRVIKDNVFVLWKHYLLWNYIKYCTYCLLLFYLTIRTSNYY